MSDMTTLPAPDLRLKETAPAAWENEHARSFAFCRRYWPLIRVNASPYTMAAILPRGQTKSKWRSKPTHGPDTFPSMSGWSQTNRRGRSASPRLGCSRPDAVDAGPSSSSHLIDLKPWADGTTLRTGRRASGGSLGH